MSAFDFRQAQMSIFSAKDQREVERLTAADPIILDDVGARYEILSDETTSDEGSELSKPSARYTHRARHVLFARKPEGIR
jgi:hypothetical protein